MQERAAHWYGQALPSLAGLARVTAEERIAAVATGSLAGLSKTNTERTAAVATRSLSIGTAVTSVQNGQVGTCQASPSDLVNQGQAGLASVAITTGGAIGDSGVNSLNDGQLYDERGAVDIRATLHPADGTTVLFTLNTKQARRGYDVRSIISITGSGGAGQPRSRQNFTVEVAGVGSTKFVLAAKVENLGSTVDEVQVTIAGEDHEPLARGVERVRITFHNTDCECAESMYREIDVIGAPSG